MNRDRRRRARRRRARKPNREEGTRRWPLEEEPEGGRWGWGGRRKVGLEAGGAWRGGPNKLSVGGAGRMRKRRSRKERRVLSLSREPGARTGPGSTLLVGTGRRRRLEGREEVPLTPEKKMLNSSNLIFPGCRKCYNWISIWMSVLPPEYFSYRKFT